MEAEMLNTLGSLGGMGLATAIVYLKLRDVCVHLKGMSDAFIKMEERGYRLARPTPQGRRAASSDGIQ